MAEPLQGQEFRTAADKFFRNLTRVLIALGIGLIALGWFLWHWTGLLIALGVVVVAAFPVMVLIGFFYAMTQDGA